MSHFFMHNTSLICGSYDNFKSGIGELVEINRRADHTFYKHYSCYEIGYFLNEVFCKANLPEERIILEFFEKLTTCDSKIECEASAKEFCNSDINGFLGINFEQIIVADHKKIIDQNSYENWTQHYQSSFEKLIEKFPDVRYTSKFQKAFNGLSNEVQSAILSKLDDAIAQNCIKQPDGNIVKEVHSNKCKVLELRVYNPIALRVYLNWENEIVNFASIEQKSNPDQNEDIKNAEKLLVYLNSK